MKLGEWREPRTEFELHVKGDLVLDIHGFQPIVFRKYRLLTRHALMITEDFKGKFKPAAVRPLRKFFHDVCSGCFIEAQAHHPQNIRFVKFLGFRFAHDFSDTKVFYWSDF